MTITITLLLTIVITLLCAKIIAIILNLTLKEYILQIFEDEITMYFSFIMYILLSSYILFTLIAINNTYFHFKY